MTTRTLWGVIAAILVLLGFTAGLEAQSRATLGAGDRLFGVWVGMSPDSPVGDHLGITPGRRLFLMGMRAEWMLATAGPFAVAATSDLIPIAALTNNPTYTSASAVPDAPDQTKIVTGRSTVYGAGLSPVGLQLYLARLRNFRMFAAGAAGMLWFTRNTPVPDARRFNFTFETGGGFEMVRSRNSVVLGYKFHHFSNASTAPRNPGVDGNVIYVGVLTRR